jgi:hypothetical protein
MKIPVPIVVVFLTAMLSIEAWTLGTLISLKADVAAIKVQISTLTPQLSSLNPK